jgi:uracil phosphoribosyltransferase
MYRAKESLLPIQYYNRLPKGKHCDVAYIVDPCIATANTINAVVSILKRWGAKKIVVIATIGSRAGINRLLTLHPTVDVYIGAIDENISEEGMILPGIGDAGDRQFGTLDEIPDLLPEASAISPPGSAIKRKRDAASASNSASKK